VFTDEPELAMIRRFLDSCNGRLSVGLFSLERPCNEHWMSVRDLQEFVSEIAIPEEPTHHFMALSTQRNKSQALFTNRIVG
jgi:hypothetical protein